MQCIIEINWMKKFVPSDTRYIPLTQQKWLCVPTCIQMVMIKHQIPLVPAEVLGNMMGLIVPPVGLVYFWHARTGERPPSGWGTQAGNPSYGPNHVFKKLGIPLKMTWRLISTFKTKQSFYDYVSELEKRAVDILVCYDWGTLFEKDVHGGHVCVLDTVDMRKLEVRIIDPEYDAPKWRIVPIDRLYEAMVFHGSKNSGGFWELEKVDR